MRRRLLTIAIFLLAGAAVNVAVAWGMAASVNPYLSKPPVSRPDGYEVHLRSATITVSAGQIVIQYVATAGWPLTCGSYEYNITDGVGSIKGGFELGDWPGRAGGFGPRALPLRPVWPGFAVNTLLYGTLLCLLSYLAIAVRRFLRLRRGLCPKCAYPMGESAVCTECGRELPQRVRAGT